MNNLKPCPFCGGVPKLYRPTKNNRYAIVCVNCDLLYGFDPYDGGKFDTTADAKEAWNRRADDGKTD